MPFAYQLKDVCLRQICFMEPAVDQSRSFALFFWYRNTLLTYLYRVFTYNFIRYIQRPLWRHIYNCCCFFAVCGSLISLSPI